MPDRIIIIKSQDLAAVFVALAAVIFLLISVTAWSIMIASRMRIAEENIAGLRVDFETTARPLAVVRYGKVYFNGQEIAGDEVK